MRTEKSIFSRAAKPDAMNSVDNLIMTRVFQIILRQQVITNSGTQQREDGSTMQYAKALPRDFRFLPGLHGARRTGASQPIQKEHGTRDEGNTTRTLHTGSVVFRCRLCLPLAVSISFINSSLADDDYPPRRRRGKNCCCATSQLLSETRSRQSQQPRPNGSW